MVKIKNYIAAVLMNDVYFVVIVLIAACLGAIIGTTTIFMLTEWL